MALPDAIQGGLRPSLLITWYKDGTTLAEDLTNATLTGWIRNRYTSAVAVAITGVLTVTDPPGGVFRWDLSAADVALTGGYEVQFTATFPSGQTPAKTFVTDWDVLRSLT